LVGSVSFVGVGNELTVLPDSTVSLSGVTFPPFALKVTVYSVSGPGHPINTIPNASTKLNIANNNLFLFIIASLKIYLTDEAILKSGGPKGP
jgi:hypothetical protein